MKIENWQKCLDKNTGFEHLIKLTGLSLTKFQKTLTTELINERFLTIETIRQSGRLSSTAIAIIYYLLSEFDNSITLCSNKYVESVELINKVTDICDTLEIQYEVRKTPTLRIHFKETGNRIISHKKSKLPVVGYHVDWMIFQNMGRCSDNLLKHIHNHVFPMINASTKDKLLYIETVDSYNDTMSEILDSTNFKQIKIKRTFTT
tara:strand:- start:1874 stop:2488 length:615 start_codon:yes stop_codon:yes gene_type:complete